VAPSPASSILLYTTRQREGIYAIFHNNSTTNDIRSSSYIVSIFFFLNLESGDWFSRCCTFSLWRSHTSVPQCYDTIRDSWCHENNLRKSQRSMTHYLKLGFSIIYIYRERVYFLPVLSSIFSSQSLNDP
jgi:hypothetical protein